MNQRLMKACHHFQGDEMLRKTEGLYILLGMFIAILGRQPALGMAELERTFGKTNWFSSHAALVDTAAIDVTALGGTLKAGRVILDMPSGHYRTVSTKIIQHYSRLWSAESAKITLGISVYGFSESVRDIQKTGLILKKKLREHNTSLRLIPNTESALNTAVSHHNKLGLSPNKVELLVARGTNGRIIVAESIGAQNITALARRDQDRPKRDAFVGMLPPKLAQIMINFAHPKPGATILDPFCGTGVVLQEALLLGYPAYGTDLADKMVDYSRANLEWLTDTHRTSTDWRVHQGDAMTATWQSPIGAVVCETYLGQPFSAPPSPPKLTEVRGNCNHIIATFLFNLAKQITPGTPLCIAVPAWRGSDGVITHLPLIHEIEKLGYQQIPLVSITPDQLLYYREDQVVARELLVLIKQ